MNRVIKFRAWDGMKMRTSFVVHNESGKVMLEGSVVDTGEKILYSEPWKLMQFSGLLDKSGKEIYEGDVVAAVDARFNGIRPADRYRGEVIFQDGGFRIAQELGRASTPLLDGGFEVEIIGNIYENPELLEV